LSDGSKPEKIGDRSRGIFIIRSRYQAITIEDAEDFMCAAVTVILRVCKPVRLI
jgi:hypothetical protein